MQTMQNPPKKFTRVSARRALFRQPNEAMIPDQRHQKLQEMKIFTSYSTSTLEDNQRATQTIKSFFCCKVANTSTTSPILPLPVLSPEEIDTLLPVSSPLPPVDTVLSKEFRLSEVKKSSSKQVPDPATLYHDHSYTFFSANPRPPPMYADETPPNACLVYKSPAELSIDSIGRALDSQSDSSHFILETPMPTVKKDCHSTSSLSLQASSIYESSAYDTANAAYPTEQSQTYKMGAEPHYSDPASCFYTPGPINAVPSPYKDMLYVGD